MRYFVMAAIIVKANLLGNLSGLQEHLARQKHTVKVGEGEYLSKIILHTDREETLCSRSTRISEDTVDQWIHGEAPSWEDSRDWKRMSYNQRILSYIAGFDEGYGVSYEIIT